MSVAVIGIIALLVMLLLEVPVAIALAAAGGLGLYLIGGMPLVQTFMGEVFHEETSSYVLIAIPMFVLMSQFLAHSGLAKDIVQTGDLWLRKIRGGLGIACVLSSAMLAAVIGTSTAATATIASATYPTMRALGYKSSLALGIIVASGTLSVMIPPGLILIIYAILTEESIGRLFIAGIVPGVLTAGGYILTVIIIARIKPDWMPAARDFDRVEAVRSLKSVWPIFALVIVVIGALYGGVATPSEVGALGALAALFIIMFMRRVDPGRFGRSFESTIKTTVMMIAIMTGAMIFGYFLTLSQATQSLITAVNDSGFEAWTILLLVVLGYLIIGLFMDQLAILALTVPTTYALISSLGFDGVWFGIVIVKTVEIGLITPPLGLNVFVASGVTGVKPLTGFIGAIPFLITELLVLALLLAFPELVLWLPDMAAGT